MDSKEAAEILREYNQWRRTQSNNVDIPVQPKCTPEILGQAIDAAITMLDKAAKWDALDERIGAFYDDVVSPEYDEAGLVGIGEAAAHAFGYL